MSDQPPKRLAEQLQLLIDIVRMRRGPQDLAFDHSLLMAVVLAYGLLQLAMGLLLSDGKVPTLPLVVIQMGVTLVSLHWLLRLAGKPERFVQTATAIFGSLVVLAPARLTVAWLAMSAAEGGGMQLPAMFLNFALAIWVLVIVARIVRAATGWLLPACVAAVFAVEMFTLLILMLLFPQMLSASAPT